MKTFPQKPLLNISSETARYILQYVDCLVLFSWEDGNSEQEFDRDRLAV